MKRVWTVLKWCLIGWGAISAAGIICLTVTIGYRFGPGNVSSTKTVSLEDVRHVLNWCGLGDERIVEVLHSYVSARSFTGEHLDAYAIRISHVDAEELKRDDFGSGWTRCSDATGVLADALGFTQGSLGLGEIDWFLTPDEIRSGAVFVYPWSIYCHGTRPTAVQLIFVRPADKMIFYLSSKT